MRAETSYVSLADADIAYQVTGDGPVDLLIAPNAVSNVEARWDDGRHARFLARLGGFARVIALDARGTGLSVGAAAGDDPTLQQWRNDALAVLDAVDAPRPAVVCSGASTLVGVTIAADAPERVPALVIVNGTARFRQSDDYRIGLPDATVDRYSEQMVDAWGRLPPLDELAPSDRGDEELERQHARYQRLATTPRGAARLIRLVADADVRGRLPDVAARTLVVHRRGNRYLPLTHGRYLAQHIADARLVELPGEDHLYYAGDADAIVEEIQDFLTGTRGPAEPDRRVLTLVFIDLVGSTTLSASLGAERWRRLNTRHLAVVRREVERFRGRVLQELGDGTLSAFESAGAAVRAGLAATTAVRSLGLEVRVGVHTGEVDSLAGNVAGIAVHIAARVQGLAQPGQVLVSRTVAEVLTGVGVEFDSAGEHELRGVPGRWPLFAARR